MKKFLEKYPLPISGLALGIATLGNLLNNYGAGYKVVSGWIAFIMMVILTVKILSNIEGFKKAMENPVISGGFATFSMAIIVLSAYITPKSPFKPVANIAWYVGIAIHVLLIIWFTLKFAVKKNIATVFTTWFIVYVGIVTATVTAPAYKMPQIGQAAFWFGFVTYMILLPVVFYRVVKVKNIPEPAQPTFAVFAAPAALLLAGYMAKTFPEKNLAIVYFLLFLTILLYVMVLVSLPKLLKLPFYPSYSAFTFPTAISALGLKLATKFLKESGANVAMLAKLVNVAEIVATVIIIYVMIRHMMFMLSDSQKK